MRISVELTFTPLQNEFEETILKFIKKLRSSQFTVLENPLSTQVYGEYSEVMEFLTTEMKEAFELIEIGIIWMKIIKSDRSNYVSTK